MKRICSISDTVIVTGFFFLVFMGFLLWARSNDQFRRIWFKLDKECHGVAVLPKLGTSFPIVIFAYGSGSSMMSSGSELRQFAEVGFGAVAIEYDKHNQENFNSQFRILLKFLNQQSWVKKDQIVWIGFSRGAQHMLSLALTHPDLQPAILARLGGGLVPELQPYIDDPGKEIPLHCEVILAHGEKDTSFPVEEVQKLSDLLIRQGIAVRSQLFSNHSHGLDSDRKVFYRILAEYCQKQLCSGQSFQVMPAQQKSFLPLSMCFLPALACLIFFWWRKRYRRTSDSDQVKTGRLQRILDVIIAVLIICCLLRASLQLITPRMKVSPVTLAVAEEFLISPRWEQDFKAIAFEPYWSNERLKSLLTHLELSHYSLYELVNWKMNTDIYRRYVLSPLIDFKRPADLNWRRNLWEFFYPRITKEQKLSSAAEIVVRNLRERVTIDPKCDWPVGIDAIWYNRVTTPYGFERIYVAALRSVGIPARLNSEGKVEFWDGAVWTPAPRPLIETWL